MLVHKRTLGVLSKVWNPSGTRLVSANFKTCPECTPDEWWYINFTKQRWLALEICRFYPDFVPQVDNEGHLVGIVVPQKEPDEAKRAKETITAEQREQAAAKGYQRYYYSKGQRDGVLDVIADALQKRARTGAPT